MAKSLDLFKRCFCFSSVYHRTIKHVTVIGSGVIGSGIAQVTAQAGYKVTIVNLNEDMLKNSTSIVLKSIERIAKKTFKDDPTAEDKFVRSCMGNIFSSTSAEESVARTDLVIEATLDNLEVKQKLFSDIDKVAPKNTIFATNSFIGDIASVTNRTDRFGGLHFFNPVPVMKLLEVIRTPETSGETYRAMMEWGQSVGKTCITCKDTPGFVVNRLLMPYLADAMRMLERGDATARNIDIAAKLGMGYPMGPFELLDYIGLDTTKSVLDSWCKLLPNNPTFKATDTLNKLVNEGKCGIKSGEGFYSYKNK